MADRAIAPSGTSALRLEILKELQQLTENRESRDRLDRGPLAETKGREHWVLHLLLKASELETAHTDTLIGSAYSNLVSRFEAVEDRLTRIEELAGTLEGSVKSRLDSLDQLVGTRIEATLHDGTEKIGGDLGKAVETSLDKRWAPIGDALETFAGGSKELVKGVADTFRLTAQTRLLVNESLRRSSDLGRDLVALEETLKLVLTKTLELGLAPIEHRLALIERHLGLAAPAEAVTSNGEKAAAPTEQGSGT